MQFTLTQTHLNRGLSLVSHAVPSRSTLPILANVLLTTDRGRIRLTTTNEEIGINCWIEADEITEEGTMLLPAKLLTDFVEHLPSSSVTVTAAQDASSCSIRCLRNNANVRKGADDPAEFPQVITAAIGGEQLLFMDTALLKEIIAQVVFAASDDISRPTLTGVHLDILNGQAVFAAADSHRLATRTISVPDDQIHNELLIPARTLLELARILPPEGTVQILLTSNRSQVLFHTNTLDLTSRLIEGTFPDFRRVIPDTYSTRAIMRTQELVATLKLMMPFAHESKTVGLTLCGESDESVDGEPNTVKLHVTAQDVGDNENTLNATVTGPDQHILFNIKYLADVLAVIDTPEVALEITGSQRPGIIKPVGSTDFTCVVMPMFINQPQTQSTTVRTEQESSQHDPVAAVR